MDAGVIVTNLSNGVAKKAGVLVNDILLKANGTDIVTTLDLSNILNLLLAGDKLTLEVYRTSEQKTVTIDITLE